MSNWNQYSNLLPVRPSTTPLQTHMMKPEQTSQRGTFGVIDKRHFSTLRYLILSPNLTKSSLSHLASITMRNPRRECMNKESSKWNTVPSPPLCSALQVEWADWLLSSTRGLHPRLLPKDNSLMPQQWAGYAANCLSLCFALPSSASEAPDRTTTTSLNCQSQLIW